MPYQAGTREPNWYRWEGRQPSGSFERVAVMESEHHEGLLCLPAAELWK